MEDTNKKDAVAGRRDFLKGSAVSVAAVGVERLQVNQHQQAKLKWCQVLATARRNMLKRFTLQHGFN